MPIANRQRSRLNPTNMADYLRQASNPGLVHRAGHFRQHKTKLLVYTSARNLTLNEGTGFTVPRTMRLVSISLNVADAPTGTLTCDILVDGVSIFESASSKPEIATGETESARKAWPDRNMVNAGSTITVQLTDTGSATGPLVVDIEYKDEGA